MAQTTRRKPLKEHAAFKKLRGLLQQPGQRDLLWYHRAGECVNRLFPVESGHQYGQSRMIEITAALGRPEFFANTLWNCRKFFRGYRREEAKQLCDPKNTQGFQLTWTHIKCLLVADEKARSKFQKQCIDQRWSTVELRRVIQEVQGVKSFGGKSFDRPKTLDAGLRQLISESNTWIRRHRTVWFAADCPVISEDSQQVDPEQIPELLREAIESFDTIGSLVTQYAPRLKKLEKLCKKGTDKKAGRKAAKKAKPKTKASRKR